MTAENEDRNAWKRPLLAHNYNTFNVKKKKEKEKGKTAGSDCIFIEQPEQN